MSNREEYPWRERWPLVIDVRIARDPAGKGYNYRQQALVRLGFPPNYWLDPELARHWRNVIAPADATPNAVQAWRARVIDLARIATAQLSPKDGDRYLADLDHDLKLIGQHDAALLASTTGAKASKPKGTAGAVLAILRAQPKGKGVSGKEIIAALKRKRITLQESTLRRHILPKLAEQFGVVNQPSAGGYLIP